VKETLGSVEEGGGGVVLKWEWFLLGGNWKFNGQGKKTGNGKRKLGLPALNGRGKTVKGE